MSETVFPFARTLKRPFLAVIFQTPQTAGYPHWGYMSLSLLEFAGKQPGFLGAETERLGNGFSITVSYWVSEAAVQTWEAGMENKPAGYKILISRVESDQVSTAMV